MKEFNRDLRSTFDRGKLYSCAQIGHYRQNGFCSRCEQELPEETIEENLQKQVNALRAKVHDLEEQVKHAKYESLDND